MAVGPITGATAPTGIRRTRAAGTAFTGFALAFEPNEAAALPESGPVSAPSLSALLALQEVATPTEQDGSARRHAEDLLKELQDLQIELLGATPDPTRLARLATLVATVPVATHPGLRAAIAAVAMRAEIEIGRQTRLQAGLIILRKE